MPPFHRNVFNIFTALWTVIIVLVFIQGCSIEELEGTTMAYAQDIPNSNYEQDATTTDPVDTLQEQEEISVDSLLNELSLREKIGQLFFVRAQGYFQNVDDEDYRDLASMIKQYHLGGIVFFKGSVYGQAVLTNQLQEISDLPLWITQDMEFGAAMRVEGTTRLPPAMGIAATQIPDYAYLAGRITSQEAKALGVHQVFAPVLDVNNNPRNPVINVRSFSGKPDTVALYGQRFMEGVQSQNIIATGKHFPGHGDTDTDSHYALPVINHDYERLEEVELIPFKKMIDSGIQSIMSAHIAFPNISDNPNLPGTLDPSILQRILVDSLNFKGLIATDGLEMRGISAHFSPGEAIIRALNAGADMMLLSLDEISAIQEVERAVERGTLTEDRINRSVRKILEKKKQAELFKRRKIDINQLNVTISSPENKEIANEISRKSLALLKNDRGILPLQPNRYSRILLLSVTDNDNDKRGAALADEMRKYHPSVRHRVFHRNISAEDRQDIIQSAQWANLIVIGSHVYINSSGEHQFNNAQRRLLHSLPENTPKGLVTFGNPYTVGDLPDARFHLLAWQGSDLQLRNTAPALFGASDIGGRLPIEIPGSYGINRGLSIPQTTIRFGEPESVGLLSDSLFKIDTIMHDAIFDSTFPGGVVTVVKDGVVAYQKGFGYETYDKHNPVNKSDIYDLASLTKVAATTPAMMKLIDEGKINLDDKISSYFPEFNKGKKQGITIRHLLLHTSGLPAYRIYVDKLQSRNEIVKAIKNEPLVNEPGAKYEYSDLGYILMGEIVEKITGKRLDRYMRDTFYAPMGMNNTHFNPRNVGQWITNRIPPTEIDTTFRQKTIRAEVHDERAYYMDGVAGHAGLFSSGSDLAAYTQMLLNGGTYGGQQYLSPAVINSFIRKQSEQVNRGLGFDRKDEDSSSAGSLTSERTFGHTGFTGTSFWVDPEHDLSIIILTNRVHPYRSYGRNISKIRAAVADAVITSVID